MSMIDAPVLQGFLEKTKPFSGIVKKMLDDYGQNPTKPCPSCRKMYTEHILLSEPPSFRLRKTPHIVAICARDNVSSDTLWHLTLKGFVVVTNIFKAASEIQIMPYEIYFNDALVQSLLVEDCELNTLNTPPRMKQRPEKIKYPNEYLKEGDTGSCLLSKSNDTGSSLNTRRPVSEAHSSDMLQLFSPNNVMSNAVEQCFKLLEKFQGNNFADGGDFYESEFDNKQLLSDIKSFGLTLDLDNLHHKRIANAVQKSGILKEKDLNERRYILQRILIPMLRTIINDDVDLKGTKNLTSSEDECIDNISVQNIRKIDKAQVEINSEGERPYSSIRNLLEDDSDLKIKQSYSVLRSMLYKPKVKTVRDILHEKVQALNVINLLEASHDKTGSETSVSKVQEPEVIDLSSDEEVEIKQEPVQDYNYDDQNINNDVSNGFVYNSFDIEQNGLNTFEAIPPRRNPRFEAYIRRIETQVAEENMYAQKDDSISNNHPVLRNLLNGGKLQKETKDSGVCYESNRINTHYKNGMANKRGLSNEDVQVLSKMEMLKSQESLLNVSNECLKRDVPNNVKPESITQNDTFHKNNGPVKIESNSTEYDFSGYYSSQFYYNKNSAEIPQDVTERQMIKIENEDKFIGDEYHGDYRDNGDAIPETVEYSPDDEVSDMQSNVPRIKTEPIYDDDMHFQQKEEPYDYSNKYSVVNYNPNRIDNRYVNFSENTNSMTSKRGLPDDDVQNRVSSKTALEIKQENPTILKTILSDEVSLKSYKHSTYKRLKTESNEAKSSSIKATTSAVVKEPFSCSSALIFAAQQFQIDKSSTQTKSKAEPEIESPSVKAPVLRNLLSNFTFKF